MKFIVFLVLSLYYSHCQDSIYRSDELEGGDEKLKDEAKDESAEENKQVKHQKGKYFNNIYRSEEWVGYFPLTMLGKDKSDKAKEESDKENEQVMAVVVGEADVNPEDDKDVDERPYDAKDEDNEEGGDEKLKDEAKDEPADENEQVMAVVVGEVDENPEDDKDLDERPLDAKEEDDEKPVDADKEENERPLDAEKEENERPVDAEEEDNGKPVDAEKEENERPVDAEEEDNGVAVIVVDALDENLMDDEDNENNQKPRMYDVSPTKDMTQLFGTNQHYNIPSNYQDLGRRFIPQYLYTKKKTVDEQAEEDLHNTVQQYIEDKQNAQKLVPIKAPPEFVLEIAKKSAILERSKPRNPSDDIIEKDILRNKNYWNDVWLEEVNPKTLRSSHTKYYPDSVKAVIQPGSKLYNLVSSLKEKSPRLVYVINKNDE